MRKLNINLPKYRLFLQFKFIRRRKPLVAEPLIPTPGIINKKYRKGSFFGRYFRHIFEHKNIKKALGTNLAVVAIATSLVPTSTHVLAQEAIDQPVIESQVTLTTQKGIQYPTGKVSITQRYSFFHPGIDLDGLTGDSIKPIKPGKVISVSYSKFAYGNSVLIDHGNQINSLYAHLSKVEVKAGDEVTMETEIGKMGATGRSFGDHLHLEVYDHGKAINPLTVLPK